MLGGSAFSQLGALIDNPASLPSLIGTALPASSNFFINYIIIQVRPGHAACADPGAPAAPVSSRLVCQPRCGMLGAALLLLYMLAARCADMRATRDVQGLAH